MREDKEMIRPAASQQQKPEDWNNKFKEVR